MNTSSTHVPGSVPPPRNDRVPEREQKYGFTNLVYFAMMNDLETVRNELDAGANINEFCNRKSALYYAVCNQSVEMCRFLIERGAKIHWGDDNEIKSDETPLRRACEKGNQEIVEMFLKTPGVNPRLRNNRATPMFFAYQSAKYRIVDMLVEYGCNKDEDTYLTPYVNVYNKNTAFISSGLGARGQM
jgi:ankyrin repeat protein